MSSETSFRDSLRGFRWARDLPQQEGSPNETNPFARFTNSLSGYVPLRSSERTNEEEAFFALSRWERLLGFVICCLGAAACFAISFFIGLPFLPIKPYKFAVSFSLGSLLFMVAFSLLQGPLNHLKHIVSKERAPFTVAWVSTFALTLYFALGARSYIGTLVAGICQVGALVSYLFAYFPGGWQTLRFGGRLALQGAGNLLPV